MAPTELALLQDALALGQISPVEVANSVLKCSNSNAGRNVYLWQDREMICAAARQLPQTFPDVTGRPLLYGLPVSLKDCFNLTGTPTSCGTFFYAKKNGIADADSWVAERLKQAGAVIVGKTHLHPLAYGITGENPDFGDCLQPRNREWLTGGSSSGAAASVQEGSALAAIGTDTGGSIRVPAALCGLAGYRSSWGLGSWNGAAPLAKSFDTIGWLYRDLEDGPLLASALFDLSEEAEPLRQPRVGVIADAFLEDCDKRVLSSFHELQEESRSSGATLQTVEVPWWNGIFEIFAGIQAHEAAKVHEGNWEFLEDSLAERLKWGASLAAGTIASLRERCHSFCARMDQLLREFDFLALPAAPVTALRAGADHRETRQRLLRYTVPASLSGIPAVTIPMREGGIQLLAARNHDALLLAFSAKLGERRRRDRRAA